MLAEWWTPAVRKETLCSTTLHSLSVSQSWWLLSTAGDMMLITAQLYYSHTGRRLFKIKRLWAMYLNCQLWVILYVSGLEQETENSASISIHSIKNQFWIKSAVRFMIILNWDISILSQAYKIYTLICHNLYSSSLDSTLV